MNRMGRSTSGTSFETVLQDMERLIREEIISNSDRKRLLNLFSVLQTRIAEDKPNPYMSDVRRKMFWLDDKEFHLSLEVLNFPEDPTKQSTYRGFVAIIVSMQIM